MRHQLAFAVCIESGRLEQMGVMLVESIRSFAGEFRDAPIWVITPRNSAPLKNKTVRRLSECDTVYLRANINTRWKDYGLANKPYTGAFLEDLLVGRVDTLCLVDADSFFLQPPELLRLPEGKVVAAAPVAKRNVGQDAGEPPNGFWSLVAEACGAPPDCGWSIEPRVGEPRMRPYFNSGLLAVRPERRIFQRWADALTRLAGERRLDGLSKIERYFVEQATFSGAVTATCREDEVLVLEKRYNYLLASHHILAAHNRVGKLEDLVHVHYTDVFSSWRWEARIPIGDELLRWLRKRVPIAGPKDQFKLGAIKAASKILGRGLTAKVLTSLRRG